MTEAKGLPDIGIDPFKALFLELKDKYEPEHEAIMRPLSNMFWKGLRQLIDKRRLINIAVRGEVRTGKSTVVIKVAWEINKYMDHVGLNKTILDNMSKYIFSDQTEFLRFINGDERNLCLAIDEFNSMAKTGLNATTEEALFDYYSDVFAGQYQHRITASPDVITDKNATIILDTIGKDEELEIVRCKLTYRDISSKATKVLGHVDIHVKDLIAGWQNKGREIIETKGIKNLEEQKKIDEASEDDFYIKYQVKKYKRMDLLKKHGVRDIRELEYSNIILDVVQELEEQSKIGKVDRDTMNLIVSEVVRRHKRIYTMLVLAEIGSRASGLLNINTKINEFYKRLKGGPKSKPSPDEEIVLRKAIQQLKDMLAKRMEEQNELSKLYVDYLNIR